MSKEKYSRREQSRKKIAEGILLFAPKTFNIHELKKFVKSSSVFYELDEFYKSSNYRRYSITSFERLRRVVNTFLFQEGLVTQKKINRRYVYTKKIHQEVTAYDILLYIQEVKVLVDKK